MDELDIDLRGILSLLRRRIRLIGLTVAVVLGVAILALVAATPIYTASSLILVDTSRKNLLDGDAMALSSAGDNARVDSEVEILRSNAVLLSVIRNQNLVDDPEFGVSSEPGMLDYIRSLLPGGASAGQEDPLQQVLRKLSGAVSVQRRGLTYLITAGITSQSPERAATLANAFADAYIAEQLQSKISSIRASQEIIAARLDQTQALLGASESAFDDFINANIERLSGQEGFTNIQDLRNQLARVSSQSQEITTLSETVERSLGQRDWNSIVAALQSDAIEALNQQRLTLSQQLTGSDSDSALTTDLRAQLQAIEQRMNMQATTELATLQSELPNLQSQADSVRRELRAGLMSSNLPVEVLTQLYSLQQSTELVRTQYQTLLARNSDLQVQADLQVADSRVVAPALAPLSPSFPNPRLILMLAGLMGLGLGVGLAFLYENYLGGFTSEAQLGAVLKVPVLAEIPRQKDLEQGVGRSVADTMIEAPLSIYAESVRRVRSGIDNALRRSKARPSEGGIVIMVSSTSPGEGKSTLSLSLARAYALSGKKTVLIDADMRKPSIHKHVGIDADTGLAETLQGQSATQTAVSRDPRSDATLIVGSRSSNIPTDQLVLSDGFERLMAACRTSFEVTIIDTPPIGPVVDATHIAPHADVILFVTRWSSTHQAEVRSAMNRLVESCDDNPIILAVLNQQEGFSSRYYHKRYAGYYAE